MKVWQWMAHVKHADATRAQIITWMVNIGTIGGNALELKEELPKELLDIIARYDRLLEHDDIEKFVDEELPDKIYDYKEDDKK